MMQPKRARPVNLTAAQRVNWLWATAILVLCLSGSSWAYKLYVYFPTVIRPHVLSEKLQGLCPGAEILVFGRFVDFQTKVTADKPDAILTMPAIAEQAKGYAVLLTGHRSGQSDESYILLSIDKKVDPSALAQSDVGVLDILGRDGMNRFAKDLLGVVPRLKRVNKIEDLLPLLTFNMASAALVPRRYLEYFSKTSKLNFAVSEIPGTKVGIAVLAVRSDADGAPILQQVRSFGPEPNAAFSVDQWK